MRGGLEPGGRPLEARGVCQCRPCDVNAGFPQHSRQAALTELCQRQNTPDQIRATEPRPAVVCSVFGRRYPLLLDERATQFDSGTYAIRVQMELSHHRSNQKHLWFER